MMGHCLDARERHVEPLQLELTMVVDERGNARLSLPEHTIRAIGGPAAIRFFRDAFGRLRIAATEPDVPGAIPIRPISFPIARAPMTIVAPPLRPGRYMLERSDDATLIVVGG